MVSLFIVTRDMVWKLGELQSVYNELHFNVETASPCTNLLKFCWLIFRQYGWVIQQCDAIRRLLHYTKNSLSSTCTSQHKHEQKDKTKTLFKFPDHVFIDFGLLEGGFLLTTSPKYRLKVSTKFYPDVLLPQRKDNVKWVGSFFYRSSLSCFFLEKFRFERYADIILVTSQCIMYFKTT